MEFLTSPNFCGWICHRLSRHLYALEICKILNAYILRYQNLIEEILSVLNSYVQNVYSIDELWKSNKKIVETFMSSIMKILTTLVSSFMKIDDNQLCILYWRTLPHKEHTIKYVVSMNWTSLQSYINLILVWFLGKDLWCLLHTKMLTCWPPIEWLGSPSMNINTLTILISRWMRKFQNTIVHMIRTYRWGAPQKLVCRCVL